MAPCEVHAAREARHISSSLGSPLQRAEPASWPHERPARAGIESSLSTVERIVSPEAHAYFRRIVRVTQSELEKLFVYKTQQLFDPVHPDASADLAREVLGADAASALSLPSAAQHSMLKDAGDTNSFLGLVRGRDTQRLKAKAAVEGQNLTRSLVGVLGRILVDFTRYAETLLRWEQKDMGRDASSFLTDPGRSADARDLSGFTAEEKSSILERLERQDQHNSTLETKYNTVSAQLRESRTEFMRERLVWKERLHRAHSMLSQADRIAVQTDHDVEFYNEQECEVDVAVVREQYELRFKAMKEEHDKRVRCMKEEVEALRVALQETQESMENIKEAAGAWGKRKTIAQQETIEHLKEERGELYEEILRLEMELADMVSAASTKATEAFDESVQTMAIDCKRPLTFQKPRNLIVDVKPKPLAEVSDGKVSQALAAARAEASAQTEAQVKARIEAAFRAAHVEAAAQTEAQVKARIEAAVRAAHVEAAAQTEAQAKASIEAAVQAEAAAREEVAKLVDAAIQADMAARIEHSRLTAELRAAQDQLEALEVCRAQDAGIAAQALDQARHLAMEEALARAIERDHTRLRSDAAVQVNLPNAPRCHANVQTEADAALAPQRANALEQRRGSSTSFEMQADPVVRSHTEGRNFRPTSDVVIAESETRSMSASRTQRTRPQPIRAASEVRRPDVRVSEELTPQEVCFANSEMLPMRSRSTGSLCTATKLEVPACRETAHANQAPVRVVAEAMALGKPAIVLEAAAENGPSLQCGMTGQDPGVLASRGANWFTARRGERERHGPGSLRRVRQEGGPLGFAAGREVGQSAPAENDHGEEAELQVLRNSERRALQTVRMPIASHPPSDSDAPRPLSEGAPSHRPSFGGGFSALSSAAWPTGSAQASAKTLPDVSGVRSVGRPSSGFRERPVAGRAHTPGARALRPSTAGPGRTGRG